MDAILVALGSLGDVNPFLGIGKELKNRGHRVTILSNAIYKDRVEGYGFRFYAIGSENEFNKGIEFINSPQNPPEDESAGSDGFQKMFNSMFIQPMEMAYEYICLNRVPNETVIVSHLFGFGAAFAHEKHGIPLVNVCLAPFWLDYTSYFMIYAPINKLRRKIGLKSIGFSVHDWMFSSGKTVGLFPKWFGKSESAHTSDIELTEFPLVDEEGSLECFPGLNDFLSGGEPPIVFMYASWGKNVSGFFDVAFELCSKSGRRGVFLTKFKELIPRQLPKNIYRLDYIPLSLLLSYSSCLVYHGGIGTCAQALRAGIPHIICPSLDEQKDNARILSGLGVGCEIQWKDFTLKVLESLLDSFVNSDEVRIRCREISMKLKKADCMRETCEIIESSFGINTQTEGNFCEG
jgi:rhamnosyltransferase subunit B